MAVGDKTEILYGAKSIQYLEQIPDGDVLVKSNGTIAGVTPVADVTDFEVADGDLISVKNGTIVKLAHAPI